MILGINDDGVYQIGATATNADDLTAQAFANLTVLNVAPPPVVTSPDTVRLGTPIEIGFTRDDPGDDEVFKWGGRLGRLHAPMKCSEPARHLPRMTMISPVRTRLSLPAFDEDTAINGTASAPRNITVIVTADEISADGPYLISEGEDLVVSASAAGTPSGFSWDFNGDSVFGDKTGQNATISWDELQALPNIPVNNDGIYTVLGSRLVHRAR